jgi:hypothetical protein
VHLSFLTSRMQSEFNDRLIFIDSHKTGMNVTTSGP